MKKHLLGAFSAVILFTVPFVKANGFYIPVQSPEATSRGNAFVATSDTPAAVYYNAAGLTQLTDTSAQAGLYGVTLGLDARVAGGSFSSSDDWQIIPQIYAAGPLNDKYALGLGLNTPFGLSTEWGNSTPFRTAVGAVKAEIRYLTTWIVVAYKLTDTLSLGAGIGVSRIDGELRTGIGSTPGDELVFEGDDYSASWTLSLHWRAHQQHTFGLTYRSQTDFNIRGRAEQIPYTPRENASLKFLTPATFSMGYSYRPTTRWNIEANIEWVGWGKLNTLTLKKATGDFPIQFDWKNNLIYGLGATYDLQNAYSISLGYNYIENSQPDATFTPAVADADRHWLTCGVGYKGQSWSWNAAYQFAFSNRTVRGASKPELNGEYRSRFHSLSFSAQYKF